LRIPQKDLESILNGINDFILVISPDREIIEVNDSFLRHMNYSRDKVIGKKCYEVFKEATRKSSNCDLVCPIQQVIERKTQCQVELTRLGGDNQPRYSELSLFPIWKDSGEISMFVEISRDITKRKRDEKEMTRRLEKMVEDRTRQLKESHNKLLHQDKMSSLGKLSSSVVHEINNPISGILNLAMLCKRIIKEDLIDQKEIDLFRQYLNLIETETRRISRIVSNLLVFSRRSKIELKRISLNQLIEKTLFLNSNLLKLNNVTVETQLVPELPDFYGSEDQLQQVFMNLVSNAAESMGDTDGGVLSVNTEYSVENDVIFIQFNDTGVGIHDENISKLFEPFFTTKKKGKGVGLGLSVAYGIVEEHGGKIYVDSKPGQGASFRVVLPRKSLSESDPEVQKNLKKRLHP
jgi:two-component system, NtrC family, sensor kinase